MKGQGYIVLALIFAVIVAVFAVMNVDPVEVNYLFGTGNAPLILIILVSALMGVLITASAGVVRIIKLQREVKSLRRQNEEHQASDNTTNHTVQNRDRDSMDYEEAAQKED